MSRPIPNRLLALTASVAATLLTITGCSGGSTPPSSTASAGGTTSSAPAPGGSSPPVTPSSASSSASPTAGNAAAVLKANVCDMLDVATINSVTGLTVGAGKNFGPGKDPSDPQSGMCLWGSTTQGVQLTAYTEANYAKQKARAQAVATPVPGVGVGAWSRGAVKLGSTENVVLYADYGTFGVILAVTTPTASVDTAAALGKAVS